MKEADDNGQMMDWMRNEKSEVWGFGQKGLGGEGVHRV